MINFPRATIAADFLSSALESLRTDADSARRLGVVNLLNAVWMFLSAQRIGFQPHHSLSPFDEVSIAQMCASLPYFQKRPEDIAPLQSLQEVRIGTILSGASPSPDLLKELVKESLHVLRSFLREHLSLGFRDILSLEAVSQLEALAYPEKDEEDLEPLSEEIKALLDECRRERDPCNRINKGYQTFVAMFRILAVNLGLPDGSLKDKVRDVAIKRGIREGKIEQETKYLYIGSSKAKRFPQEVTEAEADGYVWCLSGILRLLRYDAPFVRVEVEG